MGGAHTPTVAWPRLRQLVPGRSAQSGEPPSPQYLTVFMPSAGAQDVQDDVQDDALDVQDDVRGVRDDAQEQPGSVLLLRPDCTGPIPWGAFADRLRVELRAMGIEFAASDASDVAIVSLLASCDPSDEQVRVRVEHVGTGRRAEESVTLGGPAAPERARVLALNVAEILHAAWPDISRPLQSEPRPVPAPQALPPRIQTRIVVAEPPPEPLPAAVLDLTVGVDAYPASLGALLGIRIATSIHLVGPARLGLDLGGGIGQVGDELGDVWLGQLMAGVSLLFGPETGSLPIELGPRLSIGWARAEGSPVGPTVRGGILDAVVLGFTADATVRIAVDARAGITLGVSVGYVIIGLDARSDGRRASGIGGPSIGLRLGASGVP